MSKIVTRMMAATAALGLVAAPIMANANTRAGDSIATYSIAAPGLGRADEGEGQGEGGGAVLLGILAVTAAVSGILIATDVIGDDDDDCASPGAC